jgi:acylaminoacyl-peptidase
LDRQLEISDTAAPIWLPDGSALMVGMENRGTVGVIQVHVADGKVTPLVAGKRSVTSYGSAGATVAYTASEPHRPAEVYVHTPAGERQLSDLNAAWRAEVELPEPEHFTVQSGGWDIDAWVLRPVDFKPGRRYPALVNIHGGPFAQYGWAFLDEFQVQAGAGYVVIACNPRGSSGREDAFARAIIGCPGEPDSADVLAAVDQSLRHYDFIDPTRLGLLGGSYGGYLVGWIVGHTDRFVAAVPERGLYNRYSKDGTSDIWSGYTYLRLRQWEDPELYWRYSPLAYVRDIHTPLLILHSEEDLRCPIEQAEQLFVALKHMRREVRFVRFPGENHELSRSGKPSHRLQRFGYILEWFAEKLLVATVPDVQAVS